jgi:hypothetical protein
MFPKVKEHSEYKAEDISTFKKNGKFTEIERLVEETQTLDASLVTSIFKHTHDCEYEISLKLLEKSREGRGDLSSVDMTYLLLGATINQNTDQLISLLIETSVKNIKLDVNTYINLLYYCHNLRKFDF